MNLFSGRRWKTPRSPAVISLLALSFFWSAYFAYLWNTTRIEYDRQAPPIPCPVGDEDEAEEFEDEVHSLYGKPIHEKNRQILYISVPKCGSRTFVWTIFLLQNIHHFGDPVSLPYLLTHMNEDKMRKTIIEQLNEAPKDAIIHGHFRFVNISAGSPPNPVYMSMLRDPLERFESFFYFMRHGDKDMKKEDLMKTINNPKMALANETLDDCVRNDRADCTLPFYNNINIITFCGYNPKCRENPKFALEQAKRNVDRFLVIGIMEEYDLSMRIFEELMPNKFGGASKVYAESKETSIDRSKTSFKKAPSPKTTAILKERMKYDYMFYDYVKKRLHALRRKLRIPCEK